MNNCGQCTNDVNLCNDCLQEQLEEGKIEYARTVFIMAGQIKDLQQENAQLESELRKWQNLNIENLNGVREQYLDNENSLSCASAYINGLEHTLKHYQEALKICSPMWYSCGYDKCIHECKFCGVIDNEHIDDCTYLILTQD